MNHVQLYKKVRDELTENIPDNPYVRKFNARIVSAENNLKNRPVTIGQKAPEIFLPNPEGKKIRLSSLKGKVVLLDFWAERISESLFLSFENYDENFEKTSEEPFFQTIDTSSFELEKN